MQLKGEPVITLPSAALPSLNNQAAVWIVDPQALTVSLRPIETAALRSRYRSGRPRRRDRRYCRDRRRSCAASRPEGSAAVARLVDELQSLQVGARTSIVRSLSDD